MDSLGQQKSLGQTGMGENFKQKFRKQKTENRVCRKTENRICRRTDSRTQKGQKAKRFKKENRKFQN